MARLYRGFAVIETLDAFPSDQSCALRPFVAVWCFGMHDTTRMVNGTVTRAVGQHKTPRMHFLSFFLLVAPRLKCKNIYAGAHSGFSTQRVLCGRNDALAYGCAFTKSKCG